MSLFAHWHGNCPVCDDQEAEIARLRAEVERLTEALKEFREWDTAPDECFNPRHRNFDKAEAVVRAAEKIWGVIPVTGPGTLGPDVAVPLLAYEALRTALAAYREHLVTP